QQRLQKLLRRDARPAPPAVHPVEGRGERGQGRIGHVLHPPERVVLGHPVPRGPQAEERLLLFLASAHRSLRRANRSRPSAGCRAPTALLQQPARASTYSRIRSATAFAASAVLSDPPMSRVHCSSATAFATACSSALASATCPSSSSISAAVRNIAIGLTIPFPAMSGADPCTGSNS